MNDNTILRIKVPAHLYESVKKELTLNEATKESSMTLSNYYKNAGPRVLYIANALDRLLESSLKDKNKAGEFVDLAIMLADAWVERKMELTLGSNWQYDKKKSNKLSEEMSHGLLQKMLDDLLAKYGDTEQSKSDILVALRGKINDMLNSMHPQLKTKFREEKTINEAKGKQNLGAGMEIVKEKKMRVPKDGMKKMEEKKSDTEEKQDKMKKDRTLAELKHAKAKLEARIMEMEKVGKNKQLNEEPVGMGGMEYAAHKMFGKDPFWTVVGGILTAIALLTKGPAILGALKGFWKYFVIGDTDSAEVEKQKALDMAETPEQEKAILTVIDKMEQSKK